MKFVKNPLISQVTTAMKASMPPRQAAVSTSALWHGPSCQLFVKKGSVAPGALQQDLKSRGSAVFVQPTAQTAIGPRRYGHVNLSRVEPGCTVARQTSIWVSQQ